jgi:acylphosphatase
MSGCWRYRVSGRVQGVFFRASTQNEARRLGLTGWVRNTRSGEVEVVACGAEDAVAALERWLWDGPPSARVEAVERSAVDDRSPTDFTVRY